MRTFRYAVFGLVVGAALGAILGIGQLFTSKWTKQQMTADFGSWKWAFFGGLGGVVIMGSIGAAADKKEKVKRRQINIHREKMDGIRTALGLKPYPRIEVVSEGRYNIYITSWVDPRNGKTHLLKTYLDKKGRLVSTIGTLTLLHNLTPSASEEDFSAAHGSIRVRVFQRLIDAYEKNNQVTVDEVLVQD